MFTGIVAGTRPVVAVGDGGRRIDVDLRDLAVGTAIGASIAVDGCCLTVASLVGSVATFDLLDETLRLTTFGDACPGGIVNIERSLRVGDEAGGHAVTGHVDGVGRIVRKTAAPGETRMTVELPRAFRHPVVLRGSIAFDGVSLTVAAVDRRHVTVALIPTTLALTTLGRKAAGERVHVEADQFGKIVERYAAVVLGRRRRSRRKA